MRTTDLASPVRLEWLLDENLRLDARPYVGGAHEARDLLRRLLVPVETVSQVTAGGEDGLFSGGRSSRNYVASAERGVSFVGSADMLESDLSHLPRISRQEAESGALASLRLQYGTTLVSRSGTVGRVVFTRPNMDGMWSSEHTIKVVPDPARIRPGYLFAVLASRYGTTILVNSRSGTAIRQLEPHQVADIPIPRFGDALEGRIHDLVEEAAELRADYQHLLVTATEDLFTSAGLPELIDPDWHAQPRDLGFGIRSDEAVTLRALNFGPRAQRIAERLRSVPHRTLGEICAGGLLETGPRFARVPADPDEGAILVGQRQGFWMRPEGRWISTSPRQTPAGVRVPDETVLVASQGTLGESEVYCRPILVTGSWLEFVYTEHFLRVVSGNPELPGSYLFALLRSEVAFRMLRSLSSGGKQQDIHDVLRRNVPVPLCTPSDRERIAETVRAAHRGRDRADQAEDEAFEELDAAVREASR